MIKAFMQCLDNNIYFTTVTSGNSTREIKEMDREKNNEEVSSDAMIVGNRKSARNTEGQFIH